MVLTLGACNKGEAESTTKDSGTAGDVTDNKVYELKFAHVLSENHPKGIAADEFARLIEEKSDGRIIVSVYPNAQMGNDAEISEQMLAGTLDFNAPFLATMTSYVNELTLLDLPYLFTDEEKAFNALHGDLGDEFNLYLEKKGFVGLGYWTGGFKQLTNSKKPIENIQDMDGLKMRVSQSPSLVAQYTALNAGGISVPFNELYTALQTRVVDGQENAISNIATKKFYEVQDYLTISNHGFMGYAFIMSKEKYDALPEELQVMVEEVANEVNKLAWDTVKDSEEKYLEEIKDSGVQVSVFDEEDIQDYLDKTRVVYDEFEKTENGKELLDIVNKYK